MKLSYKVLCIDDKIPLLDPPKKILEYLNSTVGIEIDWFDVSVTPKDAREDPDDAWYRISGIIEKYFSDNTFDLILVDLNMPGKLNGDEIITTIREKYSIYRPIIFYSDGEDIKDDERGEVAEGDDEVTEDGDAILKLRKAAKDENLDQRGIFIVSRDGLAAQATTIFEAMHKEERKVNRVRGLLMDRVSEFDAKIIEISKKEKLWDAIPNENQNKIVTELKKFVAKDKRDVDELSKRVNRMNIGDVQALVSSDSRDINTFRKAKLLRVILSYIDKFKGNGSILGDGIKDGDSMIETRNAFAHTTSKDLGAEQSPKECKKIREVLRLQLHNINEIYEKI